MIFPQERIAEVCRASPDETLALLGRARRGDAQALADFTVKAAYRSFRKTGFDIEVAVDATKRLFRRLNLTLRTVP